jgi:hypothetical protein
MRKITANAVSAFFAGRSFSSGNTMVTVSSSLQCTSMLLHGHTIAVRYPDTGDIHVSDAGWQTNTTKERLNGILEQVGVTGACKIGQKDFAWYWKENNIPFEPNTFHLV